MSWDSKTAARRRGNSSVLAPKASPLHLRQPSKTPPRVQPKSAHVADPLLQSFLAQTFDAAEYLNNSLPPLKAHVSSITPSQDGAVPVAELSSQTQTLLSQLNAHTTRLSNTLTQLTDDILRSGSRLAYEVELLRGETLGLSEALADGLQGDIAKFVPSGIQRQSEGKNGATSGPARVQQVSGADGLDEDPAYISQLRTLVLIRSRLDSVIKTMGDAMEFVFPPSELSVSSSFLSVSAPDAGGRDHSTEQKGQQVLQQLRDEISSLLLGDKDAVEGVDRAAQRIEQLKELAIVWKGTAEEKGRTRFIDALAKTVEDRHREVLRELEQSAKRDGTMDDKGPRKSTDESVDSKPSTGYGIMSQLQKLRGGL